MIGQNENQNMKAESMDFGFMEKAVELALEAEKIGNLPIGAVIILENTIIAEGANSILVPEFNPGKHAEMNAIDNIPVHLWRRSKDMTCYTTLEPCCMCFGRILLSGIGKVVFGANDPQGGAGCVIPHLPEFHQKNGKPLWVGPILPEVCDALFERAKTIFNTL